MTSHAPPRHAPFVDLPSQLRLEPRHVKAQLELVQPPCRPDIGLEILPSQACETRARRVSLYPGSTLVSLTARASM